MKRKVKYEKLIRNHTLSREIRLAYERSFADWSSLHGSTILITGATGALGRFIVRVLLYATEKANLGLRVVAVGRTGVKLRELFAPEFRQYGSRLRLHKSDVAKAPFRYFRHVDYVIHCAAPTNPLFHRKNPEKTYNSIVEGTRHILSFAQRKRLKRCVVLSCIRGMRVPAEKAKRTKKDFPASDDRASVFQQAMRASEALCVHFASKFGVSVRVARMAGIIGAHIHYASRSFEANLARCIVEDLPLPVMTEEERQEIRSYIAISDAASAVFRLLASPADKGVIYRVNGTKDATVSKGRLVQDLAQYYHREHENFPSLTNLPQCIEEDRADMRALDWEAQIPMQKMMSHLISGFLYQRPGFSSTDNGARKQNEAQTAPDKTRPAVLPSLQQWLRRISPRIIRNKIVFCNLQGRGFFCNPKYITSEILRRGYDWEIVWLVRNPSSFRSDFPDSVRLASYDEPSALDELRNAHIWIDNFTKIAHLERGLRKKANQLYINTWHGSWGIKKTERDVDSLTCMANRQWVDRTKEQSSWVDYFITDSDYDEKLLWRALWYQCPVRRFGHPRNDIFFFPDNQKEQLVDKVYAALHIPRGMKICLYAPTYRWDHALDSILLMDLRALLKSLGDDWVVVVRLHHFIQNCGNRIINPSPRCINGCFYPDMQELLLAAQTVITDYSSCIFDYMLTGRPAFIYAPDRQRYEEERGLYYPLQETPFPIAEDMTQLCENIQNFSLNDYQRRVREFLSAWNVFEDGHASERVVDLLQELIERA